MLAFLGAILLWVALTSPPSAGWLLVLIGAGGGALFLGWRQWQATESHLVFTENGLFDARGMVIARLDQIERIDRGIFAFKPTNGFLLRLRTGADDAGGRWHWSPGLWWRTGRRVGVGGVTHAAETRIMADMIEAALAERQL